MEKVNLSHRTNKEWIKQLSDPVDEEALFDLHNTLLCGLRTALVDVITKDQHPRTEELAHKALIKIQEELPSYNGAGIFTTWALKIAIHFAFTALRYERLVENSLDKFIIPAKPRFSTPNVQTNPEKNFFVEQIQSYILAVIGSSIESDLAEPQRTALIAIYQQGLSMEESALQLEIAQDALETLLSNTRIRIRGIIKEKLDLSVSDVFALFEWKDQNSACLYDQNPDLNEER